MGCISCPISKAAQPQAVLLLLPRDHVAVLVVVVLVLVVVVVVVVVLLVATVVHSAQCPADIVRGTTSMSREGVVRMCRGGGLGVGGQG